MTDVGAIKSAIDQVRFGFVSGATRPISARRAQLLGLRLFLVEQDAAISEALRVDLGKPAIESFTTEIGFTINEVDHALSKLDAWSKPRRTSLPLHFRPGRARIVQEPLGTVLIIAPWNYPIQTLLTPLVPALAAGNTVILKPSDLAPATSEVVARLLPKYLDPSVMQVVTGGIPETTELLAHRFDHIFFTGNGNVGRVIARAAAEYLTPVTLELGGKSPVIVTASANIAVAARRIAWGKFLNAGQTCVAPDYVLVDESVARQLADELCVATKSFFGDDPFQSPDYGRIINHHHLQRLAGLIEDGGFDRLEFGGTYDIDSLYFAPTVLSGVKRDSKVMDGEIFGPILPIVTYSDLADVISFVNERPKPLALYVFSSNKADIGQVVDRTTSGGVTINHTLMHVAVPDFPFGGIGESGSGAYHGESGFKTFSHAKPVLRRGLTPDPSIAYPPYTTFKQKVLRRFM